MYCRQLCHALTNFLRPEEQRLLRYAARVWFEYHINFLTIASTDTPGLTILRLAHLDLEGITMDGKVRAIRDRLSQDWSACIYNGKLPP